MSDVHSVGGYITAGSLFALGLSSWQVLVSLLVGICIVQFFCNLVAKPSQVTRHALPGDLPRLLRRAGRQHPGHHPRPDRGGLVRHPDLPGLGRLHAAGAALLSRTWRPTPTSRCTASRACRRWAGSPSWSCGCCRPSCSGTAWKRSASSSTGPAPRVYVVMADAVRLAGVEGRLEQHRHEPGRRQVPGLGRAAGDALAPSRWWSATSAARCSTSATSRATARASTR